MINNHDDSPRALCTSRDWCTWCLPAGPSVSRSRPEHQNHHDYDDQLHHHDLIIVMIAIIMTCFSAVSIVSCSIFCSISRFALFWRSSCFSASSLWSWLLWLLIIDYHNDQIIMMIKILRSSKNHQSLGIVLTFSSSYLWSWLSWFLAIINHWLAWLSI